MEQRKSPDDRIHRPRQIYTGQTERQFEDRNTKAMGR
jgi:citrate synthase